MNAQDCLDELRSIKDVSFSTVDEQGLPHSRIIDVMIVGDNKLYFCTARGKDFYQQLMHNPHVAVVGLNRNWQMIRLTGRFSISMTKRNGSIASSTRILQ